MEFQHQTFINQVTRIIENNLDNELFGVSELAASINLSRSQLHRKLKKISGKSSSRFIRDYRLEAAKELLKNRVGTVSEIAFRVGFSSPQYFNKCFTNYFGTTPLKYVQTQHKQDDQPISSIEAHILNEELDVSLKNKIRARPYIIPVLVTIGLFVLIALVYFSSTNLNQTVDPKRIAVLPFKNLSDNSENTFFADGIMDDILNRLASIQELHVISRTSSDSYRNSTLPIPRIADQLKVNYLISGSVRREENQVRVLIQLIDGSEDKLIWSQTYDREWNDIFLIQTDIANQISTLLKVELTNLENQIVNSQPTEIMSAYDFYLKAKELYNRYNIRWDKRDLETAIALFQQAILDDPELAPAYAGLASAYLGGRYYGKNNYGAGEIWLDSALTMCTKALSLDKTSAEAHMILGHIYRAKGENEKFRNAFKRAAKLNPNQADSHELLGMLAHFDREYDIALSHRLKALELDPKNPVRYVNVNFVLRSLYCMDLTEQYLRRAIELQPDFVLAYEEMGVVQLEKGNFQEALNNFKNMLSFNEEDLWAILHMVEAHSWLGNFSEAKQYYDQLLAVIETPGYLVTATTPHQPHYLAYILVNLGRYDEGMAQFQVLLERDRKQAESGLHLTGTNYYYNQAAALAYMGRKEEAYIFLEKAINAKGVRFCPGWSLHDPLLAPIQHEDRFIRMMDNYQKKLSEQVKQIEEMGLDLEQFVK